MAASRPTVVVLTAMALEARALAERLGGSAPAAPGEPWTVEGALGGARVVLAVTGIGKVAAARAATRLAGEGRAAAVLVAGISGSLDATAPVGTVVVARAAAQHDLDVRPLVAAPGIVPELGEAVFPADAALADALLAGAGAAVARAAWLAPVVEGLVVSGDAIIRSAALRAPIDEHFPAALAVDMETAAVAHVARLEGVPWGGVRVISDGADAGLDAAEVLDRGVRSSGLLAAIVETAVVAWAPHAHRVDS